MAFGSSSGFNFGNQNKSIFGNNQSSSNIFSSSTASQSNVFGGGNNASSTQPGNSSFNFGNTNTNTQNKSMFGSSIFPSNTTNTSPFGSTQNTMSTNNATFGQLVSSNNQIIGTFGFEFQPSELAEPNVSFNKTSKSPSGANLRFKNIVVMSQISERKCTNELRLEDYMNNHQNGNKGGYVRDISNVASQLNRSFGSNSGGLFSTSNKPAPSNLFGSTSNSNIFGNKTNTPTGFGSSSSTGFNFNQPNASTTTNAVTPFSFGQNANQGQNKFSFGQTGNTSTGIFGSNNNTQNKNGFSFSGNNTTAAGTSTSSIFPNFADPNKLNKFGGGLGTSFTQNTNTPTNIFGKQNSTTAKSGFNFPNSTASPNNTFKGFGTNNTNTSIFNNPNTGATNTQNTFCGFGNFNNNNNNKTNLTSGTNFFGNNNQKPGGFFGNTSNVFGNTSNSNSTFTGFGNQNNNNQNQNPTNNQNLNTSATQLLVNNLQPVQVAPLGLAQQKTIELQNKTIKSLLDAPYGDSPLLKVPKESLEKLQKIEAARISAPTNPTAQKIALENIVGANSSNLSFKIKNSSSLNELSLSKLNEIEKLAEEHKNMSNKSHIRSGLLQNNQRVKKISLFSDLEDTNSNSNIDTLTGNISSAESRNIGIVNSNFSQNSSNLHLTTLGSNQTKLDHSTNGPNLLLSNRKNAKSLDKNILNLSNFSKSGEDLLSKTRLLMENNAFNNSSNVNSVNPSNYETGSENNTNNENSSENNNNSNSDYQSKFENSQKLNSHPSGFISTRTDYKFKPTINRILENFDPNTNRCEVKNLTIIRPGYGQIYFPDVVNVANTNIDEIIFIRRKEVIVYPDDYENKPNIGEKLNVPAVVSLDGTFPKSKTKNTSLITDVDELMRLKWAKKLEKMTIKLDAKFIDFEPDRGTWIFQVKHFSKYALDESSSEDENVNESKVEKNEKKVNLKVNKKKGKLAKKHDKHNGQIEGKC